MRLSVLALAAAALVALAALRSDGTAAHPHSKSPSAAMSRSSASGPGPEQKNFQPVLDGFKKKFPDVTVKYTSARRQHADGPVHRDRGRQPARSRGGRQPGLVKQFAAARRSSRSTSSSRRWRRTTRPSWVTLGTYRGKLYGMVFKGANKSTVWYTSRRSRTPASSRRRPGPSCSRRPRRCGLGHEGVLDRRRRRLDADRPVREHLPAPGRPGQVRPAVRRTRSSGPIRRSRRRSRRWRRSSATRGNIFGGTTRRAADRLPDLGQQRLQRPAEGRDGDRGRLRARRRRPASEPSRSRTTTCSPFPSVGAAAPSVVGGGDPSIDVQGHARGPSARHVPREPRGGDDLGQARRLLLAEQEREGERVSGCRSRARRRRRSPRPRRSASTCPTSRRRPSAARRARASGRSCRTSSKNPKDVERHRREARDGGGDGVQEQ